MSVEAKTEMPRSDRRLAWVVLGVSMAAFGVFLAYYVPRLNNYVMSDREFTGWVGPVAQRLARGERPYIDFVLPIPPGSLALLALLQRAAGGSLLVQELWVAAIAHLLLAVLAFVIASRFTNQRVALLVSITSLVLLIQTPKECVYDHTSQLCAWGSLAAGVAALFAKGDRRRRLWWLATGFLASFTLYFKQSTAAGIVSGWALAMTYLTAVEAALKDRDALRARLIDAAHCFAGGVAGLLAVYAGLLAVGANVGAFYQAVFGDAPELKGGRLTLVANLYNYVFRHDAVRVALVPTATALALGVRVVRRRKNARLDDEPSRSSVLTTAEALTIAIGAVLAFGGATLLLALEARSIDRNLLAVVESLKNLPAYGFGFAALFFMGHLVGSGSGESVGAEHRAGHAWNAFVIAAMTSSMIYNTSFIHFSPFYYNNPEILVALLFSFVALDRAKLPKTTIFVFVVFLLPIYGMKLHRALSADTPIRHGHWAQMRVNYRGIEILRAADRVRELAGPGETVLVLPEDVQLVGLIGRPRPPLRGAIVFVDQYPRRLLQHDKAVIDENPPKVIVVHPRRRKDWQTLFNTWSKSSAAKELLDHVLDDVLPGQYRLDSTYPTIYFWDQGQLDVYVRRDQEAVEEAE